MISQQLEKVGINAPLKIIPLANYASVQKPPIPPMLSQSRSFVDFSTVGGVLTSLNGGENWFGLGTTDKTLNTAVAGDRVGATTTPSATRSRTQVQKYVIQQGYFDPILNLVQRIYCYAANVHGPSYSGIAFVDFYDTWLS